MTNRLQACIEALKAYGGEGADFIIKEDAVAIVTGIYGAEPTDEARVATENDAALANARKNGGVS